MQLNDSEWKVMRELWKQSGPASARELHDALETEWAYTTLKTLLARLAEKKAVRVEMRGNVCLYTPAIRCEATQREAVRSLLDRAFDGAFGPLLHHLMADEKMSARERTKLRRVLKEIESEEGVRGREPRKAR